MSCNTCNKQNEDFADRVSKRKIHGIESGGRKSKETILEQALAAEQASSFALAAEQASSFALAAEQASSFALAAEQASSFALAAEEIRLKNENNKE